MSSLTAEVAVAVKATMGTLNVQNGDAGKGHAMSKQIHIKLFVCSEMSLLFQTVRPDLLSFSVNYCKPNTLKIN